MKVAVLTFQNAVNYGAVLQAYSLQEALKTLGHDAQILDYRCDYLDRKKYLVQGAGIVKKLKHSVKSLMVGSKNDVFNAFRNERFALTRSYDRHSIGDSMLEFDACVVGSDQVWNPSLTNFDQTYFLDFAQGKKRVSYAASMGAASFDEATVEKMVCLVRAFDGVSVRECSAKDLLVSGGVPAESVEVVLDPVFLHNKDFWKGLAQHPARLDGEFVLVYALGDVGQVIKTATLSYPGKRIICVSNSVKRFDGAEMVMDFSPEEFLWALDNASAVVTNSFHGFALSLLMERNVHFCLNKADVQDRSSRLVDLAKLFNVEFLSCTPGKTIENLDAAPDYERVEKLIQAEHKRSLEFLKNHLVFRG